MYDSMVFYRSFYEAIKDLDNDIQVEVYNAIFGYGLNGEIPNLTPMANAIFTLVKPQIDANNKRKENGKINGAKGAEYGKLGGRPKKENGEKTPKNPKKTPKKPLTIEIKPSNANVNDNANVNVNDNVNANVNDNKEIPNNVKNVVDLYHTLCPSLPKVRVITNKRIKAIKSFLRQYTTDTIKEAFEKAEASDFLKGQNDRGWKADIDFLTNANNVAKVLEDKYKNKQTDTITGTNNNFFDKFNQEWGAVK